MNFTKFCRACTTEFCEGYQGIFLFGGSKNILELFTKCTALEIVQMDNLPAYICEECNSNLEKFYKFKLKCENSDSYFRQKLLNNSSVTMQIVDSKIEEDGRKELSNVQDFVKVKKSECKIFERGSRYFCSHCGKTYNKKESLDGHIREHQGLDPFECKLCDKSFQKLRSLMLHKDTKHNDDFQKLQCNYIGCAKTFTTKFGLKEHINHIHLGIKKSRTQSQCSYICELCGKFFTSKASLKKHSYFHTGERPFDCTYCPKRFTVKDKLKNHIMRHENIKNFECTYCGMRKVTMTELRIHMNSHTMNKVYSCPQCPAVFSRDGNAKRHFRIVHRGYRPYKCTACDQSFSKKETLKHHEMTHSGEKPHACNLCDKRFIQPIALKKHLNVHSKNALLSWSMENTQFCSIASEASVDV